MPLLITGVADSELDDDVVVAVVSPADEDRSLVAEEEGEGVLLLLLLVPFIFGDVLLVECLLPLGDRLTTELGLLAFLWSECFS